MNDIGSLFTSSLFLQDLFEFLDLEHSIKDPENPIAPPNILKSGISFENVTFRYRVDPSPVLANFSAEIPAGKTIAIVGENGAGKSTLMKLICRFYDPESGAVRLDGIDVRRFSPVDLRSMITVLFQRPVRYSDTAKENIGLGNIKTKSEMDLIKRAAAEAGADSIIDGLPDKYDQMLGYRFGEGKELSAGQWQRIALARAFFSTSPIVLLDEPTSEMDPWAESDWMSRLSKQMQNKTVVIITHKFSTAMYADLIYVLKDGLIVEAGAHDELIAKNGPYAESWNSQKRTGS
jgi:ATP-binding cassette subfamily B protein